MSQATDVPAIDSSAVQIDKWLVKSARSVSVSGESARKLCLTITIEQTTAAVTSDFKLRLHFMCHHFNVTKIKTIS